MRAGVFALAALLITACTAPAPSQATQAPLDQPASAEPAPAAEIAAPTAASAEHVAQADAAMRAAYAMRHATNGCPQAQADLHGWPAARIRHCVYEEADRGLGRARVAVVYLLHVEAGTIARWIETACALVETDQEGCFTRVLREGRLNSGYMFPVAGNMLEDMAGNGELKNYIFRNGMTASFRRGVNGGGAELSVEEQQGLAATADADAIAIPSGLTRFWRTRPADFAARFPDAGAPAALSDAASRTAWLNLARTEMLAALDSERNRLLEAWLCANATELFASPCRTAA